MANFTQDTIQEVWEKALRVYGEDPDFVRQDECRAWILRNEYGNRESEYGWEIDHITPVSAGGTDELGNLRPLQWENNASRQAGNLTCKITSFGRHNGIRR